jgi:hypothetical protein
MNSKKGCTTPRIIKWSLNLSIELYKKLVERFGSYETWENGRPAGVSKEDYEQWLDDFAIYASFSSGSINGKKAKGTAVSMQIAFAITSQESVSRGHSKSLLFNKVAAYDQKFIKKLPSDVVWE